MTDAFFLNARRDSAEILIFVQLSRKPRIKRQHGDVSPCVELAHRHTAVYAGYSRTHTPLNLDTVGQASLKGTWTAPEYLRFRENFHCLDFPDCSICSDPLMRCTRTRMHSDCL